jgi:hypothetical protein
MAKERKKVETKEVVPEPPKRAERKPYVPPAPKVREPVVVPEPEPVKEEPKPKPKPKPKKKEEEPVKVEPVVVKPVKKAVVKKPSPRPEPVAPIKKLTKKQLEKKIESEKEDTSVPQLPPKKLESILVPSTPKLKRSEDKYLSIAENAKYDERKLMTDKLIRNEVVFSHYAIDNEIGYHYYRVLTK